MKVSASPSLACISTNRVRGYAHTLPTGGTNFKNDV